MMARLLAFLLRHCRVPEADAGKVAQNRLWFATASAVAVLLTSRCAAVSLTATDVCWRHPFPHGSFTQTPSRS